MHRKIADMSLLAISAALVALSGCATPSVHFAGSPATKATPNPEAAGVARIIKEATSQPRAYQRLVQLCDGFGHRLSGSKALEASIDWALESMRKEGLTNVRREKVMIPHWVRGKESALLVSPKVAGRQRPIVMLGLGMSIGTKPEGVSAEVIVVKNERELLAAKDKVKGRIVLFNNRMPHWTCEQGTQYGKTVRFRLRGPNLAGEMGAVAVLVRSVTAHSLRTPHTGTTLYQEGKRKVPAAAITTEDADLLARLHADGSKPVVKLMMAAKQHPDSVSANAVAELRGRERPDEVVVVSGHIDSWDAGQGAHDDGAGVVMAMETLSLLKRLGMTPRRTIRMVLWTNEENGLRGAKSYVRDHAEELGKHVAAIEADFGGFAPSAFGVSVKDKARQALAVTRLQRWMKLLKPVGNIEIKAGHSAADVGQMAKRGVPALGLYTHGEHYFDYHHTPADTVDKVNPKELARSTAAMAALAWLLAEQPGRIDDP